MKKELTPALAWIAVVAVVVLVVVLGFKFMAGAPPDMDKKAADTTMQKVQAGGKMYEPPPGAIPGGTGPGGRTSGSFNLQPPSR